MRYTLVIITLLFFISVVVGMAVGGDEEKTDAPQCPEEVTHSYPIAPGVWYPGDGPLPEKPMRYYRVRCWPGCHSGSSHGKYPDQELGMKPIFHTSTIDGAIAGEETTR